VNHMLVDHRYQPAALIGKTITPEIVILHDTASRLEPFNAANYLAEADKVSVHFVVERDGTVTQQVPTNRRAGHAGKSSYHGRSDCNAFSIGIEIVNPGKLTRTNGGGAISWFGQEFGFGAFHLAELTTKEHGAGVWMPYTAEQIVAVMDLLNALFKGIPTLKDITTHWYVSPGRKVDTNPLFPLQSVRSRVLGRDDPLDAEAEAKSDPVKGSPFVRVIAPGTTLNVRRFPSFNPNVIAAAPDGAVLPLLRTGEFSGRVWNCVMFDGHEGWVLARYTENADQNMLAGAGGGGQAAIQSPQLNR
jgi:N-acetylmuramoyl-L-alanine amidase